MSANDPTKSLVQRRIFCNAIHSSGIAPGEYRPWASGFDKRFRHPPTVELTHNPPYYGEFLERYGFRKANDYHAHLLDVQAPVPDRLERVAADVRQRRGYRECEASLLLEDNGLVLSASELMGAHRYKTWRIYDLELE
jgi:hypothetical protein